MSCQALGGEHLRMPQNKLWASQLNSTQNHTPGAVTASLLDGHAAASPLHPALHREKEKVFFPICTHIRTGFGCLQAATWWSKPSTILDSAHTLQWILICAISLLIYSRICERESSVATQTQTRQWVDGQGYGHILLTGFSKSRNPHAKL